MTFWASRRSANLLANQAPGLTLSILTWPNGSRGTSAPERSSSATMVSRPAPSDRKMLTEPTSSITFLSRSASASRSKTASGT